MFILDNLFINGIKDLLSSPCKQFVVMAIISALVMAVLPQKKDSK